MSLLPFELEKKLYHYFHITHITSLQEKSYQILSSGQNCIIHSPTGSGKTLAFLLPLYKMLACGKRALIIAPSRELILQISKIGKDLFQPLEMFVCYGGTSINSESIKLQNIEPSIIFATPGRFYDHLHNHPEKFKQIDILIIDEFDKCFSIGFEEQIHQIYTSIHPKQIILTSATTNTNLPTWLSPKFTYISESPFSDMTGKIESNYVFYNTNAKLDLLYKILAYYTFAKNIIFVNHHNTIENISRFLKKRGIKAVSYFGDMPQEQRERAIFEIQNDCCHTIIATDLAARGLDIQGLKLIIEYDPSLTETIYKHRIGRTGRWTQNGFAISMFPIGQKPLYPSGNDLSSSITDFAAEKIPDTTNTTFYIGKGKKHNIRKVDILGVLCKQLQIRSDQIGQIAVFNNFSIVAIKSNCEYAFNTSSKIPIKIKKTKTYIQRASS